MLQTFVIGLGHAGAGLHLPVLRHARALPQQRRLFADDPIVVCDPDLYGSAAPARSAPARHRSRSPAAHRARPPHPAWTPGIVVAGSPAEAARLVDPLRTVVHLCTPPAARAALLGELADLGFRMLVVEKPLAVGESELAGITRLAARRGLRIAVVAQWLTSSLTARLRELVRAGTLGPLQSIAVRQHKPRFHRSADTAGGAGHPSAFDVEVPHAAGVALRLAGPAEVAAAECTDLLVDGELVPRMGGARLTLRHASGVRTEIHSDLTSPVRTRQITLRFARGVAAGHYPVSRDDDHAQLRISSSGRQQSMAFRDDALTAFMLRAYRRFLAGPWSGADFDLQVAVARLLCEAKRTAGSPPTITGTARRAPGEVAGHAN